MKLHQIKIEFVPEHDRLLLAISTAQGAEGEGQGQEMLLWLTRRCVKLLEELPMRATGLGATEMRMLQLLKEGVITEDSYHALDQGAKDEAADSLKFADESPWPTEASITEDVYFEVDRQTQAGRTGRHFFNS